MTRDEFNIYFEKGNYFWCDTRDISENLLYKEKICIFCDDIDRIGIYIGNYKCSRNIESRCAKGLTYEQCYGTIILQIIDEKTQYNKIHYICGTIVGDSCCVQIKSIDKNIKLITEYII